MSNVCLVGSSPGSSVRASFTSSNTRANSSRIPLSMLLSRGGFTIFGGLIVGRRSPAWYARRKGAPARDAARRRRARALCSPTPSAASAARFRVTATGASRSNGAAPDWLPDWLWAQTYDGNIAGVTIPPPGVYPTPIYEVLMSFAAFALLWKLRKQPHAAGWLFGVYLLLAGIERLLIESIRVNTTYDLFGFAVTQAQIIAVGLRRSRDRADVAPAKPRAA